MGTGTVRARAKSEAQEGCQVGRDQVGDSQRERGFGKEQDRGRVGWKRVRREARNGGSGVDWAGG